MQVVEGDRKQLAHAAVGVNAQHLDPFAAIALAQAAGVAGATAQVRFSGAAVARADPAPVRRRLDHFHGEFVAENPRVGEIGLPAFVGMIIRSTKSHAARAHQGLARALNGLRRLFDFKPSGLLQDHLTHASTLQHDLGNAQVPLASNRGDVMNFLA